MLRVAVGIFIVVHGLVHLLYAGQSRRLFELQPGMIWPEGAWAVSRLLGDAAARRLASLACALASVGFVTAGAAILAKQAWWRPTVVGAAGSSAALFLLFWDGRVRKLADQGAIALLINVVILAGVLVFGWPDFGF